MKHSAAHFPDALVEAVRHARLVPLVGHGISAEARDTTGRPMFPSFSDLLERAARLLGAQGRAEERRLLQSLLDKKAPDYYQAALTARTALGEEAWSTFLYTEFSPEHEQLDLTSISGARAVWDLGSSLVTSVCVDRVLSWACPRAADLGRWIMTPPRFVADPAGRPPLHPVIWHLHGLVDDPCGMILTPGGRVLYSEGVGITRSYRAALGALQRLMCTHTLLFVGFDRDDPLFFHIMRRVNDLFQECGGPHYALVPEEDVPLLAQRIGDLPLSLIPYTGRCTERLSALAQRAEQKSGGGVVGIGDALDITQAPTIALRPAAEVSSGEGEAVVQLPARYQPREKIGQGGMGAVYLTYDRQLDREVAVKVILPELMSLEAGRRFGQEARAIAKLDHPSIVPVYDYGRYQDTVYLTMPMVRGKLLRRLMQERKASLVQKLDICAQLADALDYSHAQGVYHCDIKPENIMVRLEGDRYHVRVMDFGLARLATRKRVTRRDDVVGTPLYLSPEQCLSDVVDGRTDLYALGTILYEFLTGETPFKGPFHSLLYKIVHERPPLLLSRGVDIDEELESLVLGCLAKNPDNRPQRGRDLSAALHAYLDRRAARTGAPTLRPAVGGRSDTALVGREEELTELHLRLDASLAGVCQFAVISGESGMGKRRLLGQLEKTALENSEPFQVWWGRFPEHEGTMPYQVFSELVAGYFARRCEEAPLPDLSDLAPDLVRLMPALAEIAPVRDAADKAARSRGKSRGRRFVFDLMARTIRRLSGDQPTVLLLENLGGAGGSLEALQYLVHRLAATPTFIVGTYRTGLPNHHPLNRFLRHFQGDRRFLSLELQPLDETRHRRLVRKLLEGTEAGDELLDKLYEISEGNPYFTHELVRSLQERGGLALSDAGVWELSDDTALQDDALPRTIQGAVEERIKHLDEDMRDMLATAAVLGRSFTLEDLGALLPGRDTGPHLERLVRDGILEEHTGYRVDAYTFQSRVVRDVLYQRFSRRKRREWHLQYALHLERKYADNPERVHSELVYHFAEGDDPERTVRYAVAQAERALETFAPEEAVRSIQTALSFVRDEGYEGGAQVEGRLCLLMARAHVGMGRLEPALGEAAEAVRAYKRGNHARGAAEAALLSASTAWRLHKVEVTRRQVENGIALARTAQADEVLHDLLVLAAKTANLSRNYARARKYLEEAELLAPREPTENVTGPIPYGGRLVTAVRRPIASLQPGRIQTSEELEFSAAVCETLLSVDGDGRVVPLLARGWDHRDFRVFRFYLHEDAAFADGTPLEASHVKEALEQAARGIVGRSSPAISAMSGAAAWVAGEADTLVGLQVENPHCLAVTLDEPLPIFPALMTDRANTAVCRMVTDDRGKTLVGTGPFRVQKHDGGVLELVRNAQYWQKTLSRIETLECRVMPDDERMMNALRTGDLDLARDLTVEQTEALLRTPRFQRGLVECTRKAVVFLLFNRESEVLRSREVRRVLFASLRVRELVWHTLGRAARPASCLIPPGVLGHDPARRAGVRAPGGEARILREHAPAPPLVLTAAVHPLVEERMGALVQGIFREWMTLGIEVRKVPYSRGLFARGGPPAEPVDMVFGRYRGHYDDPDAFTYQLFHGEAGMFGGWTGSIVRDALMLEARRCEDSDERRRYYRRVEAGLLDEGLVLPLFYDIDCRLAGTRLKGVVLQPNPPFVNYAELGKSPAREPTVPAGVVRVPITGRPCHLDPAHMTSYDQGEIVPNLFETLTRVGDGAHVESGLASFRTEDGGHRYHFRLQENVYFHDGRRLTTRDVRYAFERVLRESPLHAHLLLWIQGAGAFREGKAHDIAGLRLHSDLRFTIDLTSPLSFFPGILSHPALGILPEGAAPVGEQCTNLIGTGPFRLVRFVPGETVELEANLQYRQKGLPRCGRLEFHLGMGPEKIAAAFREGRVHLAAGVYPTEAETLRSLGGFRTEAGGTPGLSTYFLVFHTHQGAFASRETRRALAGALDMGAVVRETLGGTCLEAGGFIPPGLAGREARGRGTDEEHTQTLPPGFRAVASVHPHFFQQFASFWDRIVGNLAVLGMAIEPVHREVFGSLTDLPAPVDLVAYRWFADYPDADTFVKLLHRETGLFGPMVGTERIDMLIEKARVETDEGLRAEVYAEIEDIIAHEVLILPLFHETNCRLARPELRGLRSRIGFPLVSYERLYLEHEE